MKGSLHAAIDVGSTKVCTLVGLLHPTGSIEIVGRGVILSRGIRKGVVVTLAEAMESVLASVREASRSAGTSIPWAYVSVSGSHIETFSRWGSIRSLHHGDPITVEEIDRAVEAAYPAELPPEKQVLHLIPRTYAVDGLTGIRNPLGMHASRLDVETLCVVGASAPIQSLVRTVEGARVRVRSLILAGLASGEAVLTGAEKEMGVVLVEIGGGTTTIVLYQNGSPWAASVLPVGGTHFSNDLAVALNTPYEVAEEVKVRHGHVLPDGLEEEKVEVSVFGGQAPVKVERREVCVYLRDRAEELLHLVRLKVREMGFPVFPSAGAVLTGGGAKLAGLEALASRLFGCPVRVGTPRGVEGFPSALADPTYATPIGLLLWGIRQSARRSPTHRGRGRGPSANGRGLRGFFARLTQPARKAPL